MISRSTVSAMDGMEPQAHSGHRRRGLLGSHLCVRLVAQGRDVLCADHYFTGRQENIAHLLDYKTFDVHRHDATFPLHVEVDEIYNRACPVSPVHDQFDPVQTTKTSVLGARILPASTGEVCGDPTIHPQDEA